MMHQRCVFAVLFMIGSWLLPIGAVAQTATYHLHKEGSKSGGAQQLKTAAPDSAVSTISSADMRNQPPGNYLVQAFDTAAGVPNATGTIPAGSQVSFTLWMKKSANAATLFPRASLRLNSTGGAALCATTGTAALTTTLTAHSLSCTTSAAITMNAADRFYLAVEVAMTIAAGKTGVKGQLAIEGVLNGNYDSRITVPLPTLTPAISSLSPSSAIVGSSIAIAGSNFGATQGSSRTTFNGVVAVPTSWSATTIAVPVPQGATTGPVLVTVNGLTSNAWPFTVVTDGSVTGVVSRLSSGSPVAGALVELLRGSLVVASATTAADGRYVIGPVSAATYDLRASAPGLAAGWKSGIAIAAGQTRTENLALAALGSISGQVTSADSGAPISGATVSATGGTTTGAAATDASGNYTVAALPSGTYTVTASAEGYRPAPPAVVTVVDGESVTRNIALEPGSVSYAYDELDRLIAVIDPSGGGAAYRYDAVGNVLSIARHNADAVSILGFSPTSGSPGTTVTITGTGFSSESGGNTVAFNGSPATLNSTSSARLVATVPAGASSGPISVASAIGTATTSSPFTVIASAGAPSVTGFVPGIAMVGTPIVISGSNFDTSPGGTRVRQNVAFMSPTSVHRTAIEANVPAGATSGHISVRTPDGSATSAGVLFVPPAPYTTADVAFTAQTTIGGSLAISASAQKIGLIAFDAFAGQRVAIRMPDYTLNVLLDPLGRQMHWFDSFLGGSTLPIPGTYTVVQVICWSRCGTPGNVTILEVPPDVAASIVVDGPPVTFDLTGLGQRARLVFSGIAGQHLAARMPVGPSGIYLSSSFIAPSGRELGAATFGADRPLDIILPETGAYTLVLEGEFVTGHYSVALRSIQDVRVSLAVDGPTVPATTSDPGQDIYASFAGTAAARLALLIDDVTLPDWSLVSIRKADGTILVQSWLGPESEPSGGFIEIGVLPETATYTVFIDVDPPSGIGSVTLRVVTLPPDIAASIEIDGPPLTVTIAQEGQNAVVTFTGIAGQQLTIGATDVTLEGRVSLVGPESLQTVGGFYVYPMSNASFDATLPASGSYRLVVDPLLDSTGAITLTIASR